MSKRIDIRGKVYNNILPLRFIKKPSPENTHAIRKLNNNRRNENA